MLFRSLQYLEKQVDPFVLREMVAKANSIEKAFNVYRAKVDGKELSENDVHKILKNSKDSTERRKAWEGSKGVGAVVEKDLIALAKLRNQAATQLGFGNYHQMMLHLNEQDQAAILKLFDELDALTREPFLAAKAEFATEADLPVAVDHLDAGGIVTAQGEHVDLDVIVWSTGYDATDGAVSYPIIGRDGRSEEHTSELQSH